MSFLVLTRREKEYITVVSPTGEKLKVVLVKVRGKQARIGFEASNEWQITRNDGHLVKGEEKENEKEL